MAKAGVDQVTHRAADRQHRSGAEQYRRRRQRDMATVGPQVTAQRQQAAQFLALLGGGIGHGVFLLQNYTELLSTFIRTLEGGFCKILTLLRYISLVQLVRSHRYIYIFDKYVFMELADKGALFNFRTGDRFIDDGGWVVDALRCFAGSGIHPFRCR